MKKLIYLFIFFTLTIFSASKSVATLPPAKGYKIQKPLIYLDPGHGGLDLGAVIKSPYIEEKKYCLTLAHYVKRHLEQMGHKVSLTRSRDFYLSLPKRVNIANKSRAGIYVSLHFNSCPNAQANGMEIFYSDSNNKRSNSSKKLATCVLDNMLNRTKAHSRGVKKANFYVIRETNMPSIIVEPGFLTNREERGLIRQREYLNKIARGIAEGIDKFIKK